MFNDSLPHIAMLTIKVRSKTEAFISRLLNSPPHLFRWWFQIHGHNQNNDKLIWRKRERVKKIRYTPASFDVLRGVVTNSIFANRNEGIYQSLYFHYDTSLTAQKPFQLGSGTII